MSMLGMMHDDFVYTVLPQASRLISVLQNTPVQTNVLPTYQDNPLRKYTPTWEKFAYIGGHMNYTWDAGLDWLDDYTYYAEIIGDDREDWWGWGLSNPSDGDADIPQPKVFRAYAKSNWTMLDFVKYALSLLTAMLVPHVSTLHLYSRGCVRAAGMPIQHFRLPAVHLTLSGIFCCALHFSSRPFAARYIRLAHTPVFDTWKDIMAVTLAPFAGTCQSTAMPRSVSMRLALLSGPLPSSLAGPMMMARATRCLASSSIQVLA
jgi:hypothetical protein